MKFVFIVQGEGRGHMTQSLSIKEMLEQQGHHVQAILIGTSPQRSIPDFYRRKIDVPLIEFNSPNFLKDQKKRGIRIGASIFYNVIRLRRYLKSLKKINSELKTYQPDVVISFYEIMAGLYFKYYKPNHIRHITLAHQYLAFHPEFIFPAGRKLDKLMLLSMNRICSSGAETIMALSFRPKKDIPSKRIVVTPPFIRKEIREIAPHHDNYIMGYMLNSGYSDDVIRQADELKKRQLSGNFFWDNQEAEELTTISEYLHFHRLDDKKFIQMLANCVGYISTAGFESICEAFYLQKPVLMVPVENHYEQACNAIDACQTGWAIQSNFFNLKKMTEYALNYSHETMPRFKVWVDSAPEFLQKAMQKIT